MKNYIPVTGPSITSKEVRFISKAARDGWNQNHSKYINLFEKKFAKYIGRRYGLATSSGTSALHLAFLALGLKKDDEVIVPNISWIASIEPIYYIGAQPVFVDIEPNTWCIDSKDIEKHITDKTKAILVVDLYGGIADMKSIRKIAEKHNLPIVEDAAEAVGAEYFGRKAGYFGDISCFSFHGSKTLVTGEGGMLITDNQDTIEKAKFYNDHCKDPKKIFWNLGIGYKYKMSNFQAACGLAQLERIEKLIAKKRTIFSWYRERLKNIPSIQLNYEAPYTINSYWMVTIVWDKKYKISKEGMIKKFKRQNIQVRPFFYPLSVLPPIQENVQTPVSFDISSRAINLPSGLNTTKNQINTVCDFLLKFLNIK